MVMGGHDWDWETQTNRDSGGQEDKRMVYLKYSGVKMFRVVLCGSYTEKNGHSIYIPLHFCLVTASNSSS